MNEIDKTQQFNLNAYYTSDTKTKPQKKNIAQAPIMLPKIYSFSDKEADRRMQAINTDIYINAKQEKNNHKFNKNTYFKILGTLGLAVASIFCWKKFFRKS